MSLTFISSAQPRPRPSLPVGLAFVNTVADACGPHTHTIHRARENRKSFVPLAVSKMFGHSFLVSHFNASRGSQREGEGSEVRELGVPPFSFEHKEIYLQPVRPLTRV